MAEHKLQHYVPRCHFKPFSLKGEGKAIHLYNIGLRKFIKGAPVKGQCARNYIYGEDLKLERTLQDIEGKYSRLIADFIGDRAPALTEEDKSFLRRFSYLQFSRTQMAVSRREQSMSQMHQVTFQGREHLAEKIDLSERTLMRESMATFSETVHLVDDLKVVIFINETSNQVCTSDDPAILTNRYYLKRRNRSDFGIGSSGVMIFLPLTPHHVLMCYDGNVYTLPNKRGDYIYLQEENDIDAINELQFLKASSNIYFSDWDGRESIAAKFESNRDFRPKTWHKLTVLVPDQVTSSFESFRLATEEEIKTSKRRVLHGSSVFPSPRTWISRIQYRDPVRVYSNGSALGHVRRREWLKHPPA